MGYQPWNKKNLEMRPIYTSIYNTYDIQKIQYICLCSHVCNILQEKKKIFISYFIKTFYIKENSTVLRTKFRESCMLDIFTHHLRDILSLKELDL